MSEVAAQIAEFLDEHRFSIAGRDAVAAGARLFAQIRERWPEATQEDIARGVATWQEVSTQRLAELRVIEADLNAGRQPLAPSWMADDARRLNERGDG